ncbi:hypothetical protein Dimus_005715, partial [Dionaea muscipula]
MERYRCATGRVEARWSCPHQLAGRDDARRVRSCYSQLLAARGAAVRRATTHGVAACQCSRRWSRGGLVAALLAIFQLVRAHCPRAPKSLAVCAEGDEGGCWPP